MSLGTSIPAPLAALLAGLASWSAAAGSPGDTHGINDTAADGAALLLPFKQRLMGALQAGLAEGPEQAVDTCHLQAPAIAEELGGADVRLGRTSHRLRNPDNAGPAWATEVLEAWLQQPGDWSPRTVALPDGRAGYVEPIVTQPLCLVCHGANPSPAVVAAIDTHYPDDRATGFEAGDLRGAFWVSWTPGDVVDTP